jgi:hypothetical protein
MRGSKAIFNSYTSPNGTQMANPVLVNQQIDGMREALDRLRQSQPTAVLVNKQMSQLYELAQRMKGTYTPVVTVKKKVNGLRSLAKRVRAVHESSNPFLSQKLDQINQQ